MSKAVWSKFYFSFTRQFSLPENENKEGENDSHLASMCSIISKEHGTAEVIPKIFPVGKNCGRYCPFEFKMQV